MKLLGKPLTEVRAAARGDGLLESDQLRRDMLGPQGGGMQVRVQKKLEVWLSPWAGVRMAVKPESTGVTRESL